MKLSKKKNGQGYVTSYTISIGSKEARELNFIDSNGETKELEKIIDTNNSILTIRIKSI